MKIKNAPVSRLGWTLFRLMGLMIFVLAVQGKSFAAGLAIDPGEINIKNVSLGQKVAVSVLGGEKSKLVIKNKGASACTYSVNILNSAQTAAPLSEGYVDILDTAWIFPEVKEILVPGNSAKSVEIYINIPKKEKYYNKKYQAVIEVKSKKNRPEDLFVLACQLKILFSTSGGGQNENK